jgi:hypothetical protein
VRFTDEPELGGVRYRAYLASVSERLPARLKAFALQDWYYDPNDHRCPHDSWLEQLTIDEPANGERKEQRSITIRLRLLAPYHDGEILFAHYDVRQYRLETPAEYKSPPYGVGHGNFLRNEIRLLEDGFIEHDITFSRGSRFVIECGDMSLNLGASHSCRKQAFSPACAVCSPKTSP